MGEKHESVTAKSEEAKGMRRDKKEDSLAATLIVITPHDPTMRSALESSLILFKETCMLQLLLGWKLCSTISVSFDSASLVSLPLSS
jgi:hypothetical protein